MSKIYSEEDILNSKERPSDLIIQRILAFSKSYKAKNILPTSDKENNFEED